MMTGKTSHGLRVLWTAGAVGVLGATLAGCGTHGKYTGEFKEKAEQRVASMKAATEWDMANQQYLSGDLKKALRSVENSIQLNGEVAKSHLLHGRILLEDGQLEMALKAFEQTLEIDPANAEAHYYRGIIFERFSEPESALPEFLAAAEHDQSNPQYPLAAAEMLIELNRLDEADQLLEEGRAAFRHNAGIRQTLGHIAMMQGEKARAVELFDEAALLAPDDGAIIEDLARAQLTAEMISEAEYNLHRLLKKKEYSSRRDLIYLRGMCLLELDRPVDAREQFRKLVHDGGGQMDVQAWVGLGEASLILKDQRGLREAANRLVASAPNRSEGYLFMALWQRGEGDLAGAVRSLDRASARSKYEGRADLLRAMILLDLDEPEQARVSLDKALAKEPHNELAQQLVQVLETGAELQYSEVPIDE